MKLLADVEIAEMPVGAATYLDTKEGVVLVIKDQNVGIRRTPAGKAIFEIAYGFFGVGNVSLVVTMISTGDTCYEIWWNYHQEGGGQQFFFDMANQERLNLFLFDQNNRQVDCFVRENPLKEVFSKYWASLRESTPWSMEDFDRARELLYRKHPSAQDLWKILIRTGA